MSAPSINVTEEKTQWTDINNNVTIRSKVVRHFRWARWDRFGIRAKKATPVSSRANLEFSKHPTHSTLFVNLFRPNTVPLFFCPYVSHYHLLSPLKLCLMSPVTISFSVEVVEALKEPHRASQGWWVSLWSLHAQVAHSCVVDELTMHCSRSLIPASPIHPTNHSHPSVVSYPFRVTELHNAALCIFRRHLPDFKHHSLGILHAS